MEPRSCYVLEFSVQPGGVRWAELHAYANLEFIGQGALRVSSVPETAPYMLLWYGATFGVWSIQAGKVQAFLDLHPYTSVQLAGSTEWQPLDSADVRATVQALEAQDTLEVLDNAVLGVNWQAAQAQLPLLSGPHLQAGETMPVNGTTEEIQSYLPIGGELSYGSYEAESDEPLESLDPEDESGN